MSKLTYISSSKGVRTPDKIYYKYPDEFDRVRHIPYLRQRAQAKYRNEAFDLTFEQYCSFWDTKEKWALRGRQPESLVLTRIDIAVAWTVSNVEVITRYAQLLRARQANRGLVYNKPNRKGTPKNAK